MINESPDYIFLLGDISQDGTIESYQRAKSFLNNFKCLKYAIMGNHDSHNISHMLSENIIMSQFLDIDNHRFIFISSYKGVGYNEGLVHQHELNKISSFFDVTKHNYLVMHHHFIETGGMIDKYILDNHQEFCNHVQQFDFKAVFHGHVHNGYKKQLNTIDVYATPSTCIQFALSKEFKLEPIIGYQTISLMGNSHEQKTVTKAI